MARDVEETLARIAVEKGAVTDDPESIKSWLRDRKNRSAPCKTSTDVADDRS
jgi:hypothetical protein